MCLIIHNILDSSYPFSKNGLLFNKLGGISYHEKSLMDYNQVVINLSVD